MNSIFKGGFYMELLGILVLIGVIMYVHKELEKIKEDEKREVKKQLEMYERRNDQGH